MPCAFGKQCGTGIRIGNMADLALYYAARRKSWVLIATMMVLSDRSITD
jgi:hypothetical protein